MKVSESRAMLETEVLVVGAGPVGLFLASELRRRGRICLLVERRAQPSTHSKALAIMPRTLEIFELAGVAEPFLRSLNRIDRVRFVTPAGSASVGFESLDSAYPHVSMLPQWKTEQILADRFRSLGGTIGHGHELREFRSHAGGIVAEVGSPEGGYRIRSRFIAGCDGAWSLVRARSGIKFEGGSYGERALLADAVVQTEIPANEARVHINEGGVLTLFPITQQVRRVVAILAGAPIPESAGREWLQQQMDRAALPATVHGVEWSSAFQVHRRVAPRMRAGNAFIAGDAAHIHSPVGGQGMNVGLHDAWNLGWKLALVLAGDAPESLLDSFERERLPVGREVVRRTDLLTHALADPRPFARAGRRLLAPFVLRLPGMHGSIVRRLSQLDMPYAARMPDLRLQDGTRLYQRFGMRYALVAQTRHALLTRARGVDWFVAPPQDEEERVTVLRPDGYVAYRTAGSDLAQTIERALQFLRAQGIKIAA